MAEVASLVLPTALGTARSDRQEVWLKDRRWDRIFIIGGALLVPIPILVFYLCQNLGMSRAGCEDVVTLLVMVAIGGPHVFATYTRTAFDRNFVREERGWVLAGLGVVALTAGAAIASAFFDVTIAGIPPITFIMTFFFFWAGVHIFQQNAYCAACYDKKRTGVKGEQFHPNRWWNAVDYLVMLGCLYPMSLFRMSMADPTQPGLPAVNPEALSTKIALAVSGSQEFVDGYLFSIGRVIPVLPGFMMADWFWISVLAGFVVTLVLFGIKSWREHRSGTLNLPKFQLIAISTVIGFSVPFLPNLDSSFQGFNAWHSFQYLGILWLMNRRSFEKGETQARFVRRISEPDSHRRFYLTALAATLAMIALFFLAGWIIHLASGGAFSFLGSGSTDAIDPATGKPPYRPGAVLLAYYIIGFSFLLVHYLHDGVFFFRTRYLVDPVDKPV